MDLNPSLDLSVVVPVHNERDNVAPLVREIEAALAPLALAFEIVYVDDHSRDDTLAQLRALKAAHPRLRVLHHRTQSGQSTALRTGIKAARGRWIATLDGDGQNDPADIPKLLAAYRAAPPEEKVRLVGGQRVKRQDTAAKRVASRWANRLRAWLLQDDTRDTGCGLKLFDRAAFLDLPYFDHLHRYLPALIKRDGYAIRMVDVGHRPRTRGASKYGVIDRALVSIRDLMGVMWLMARRRQPGDIKEL